MKVMAVIYMCGEHYKRYQKLGMQLSEYEISNSIEDCSVPECPSQPEKQIEMELMLSRLGEEPLQVSSTLTIE